MGLAAMFGKPSLAIYSQTVQKVVPNNSSRDLIVPLQSDWRSLSPKNLLIFISSVE